RFDLRNSTGKHLLLYNTTQRNICSYFFFYNVETGWSFVASGGRSKSIFGGRYFIFSDNLIVDDKEHFLLFNGHVQKFIKLVMLVFNVEIFCKETHHAGMVPNRITGFGN